VPGRFAVTNGLAKLLENNGDSHANVGGAARSAEQHAYALLLVARWHCTRGREGKFSIIILQIDD
jgi:hypothetical protein